MSAKEILEKYEEAIKNAPRVTPLSFIGWANHIPKEAGIYVIWKAETPFYVGETSSLRLRMSDLARPINHSFTKKIARLHKISEAAYADLAREISTHYQLSHIKVELGRAEIEEYLILRWRNSLINKPTKRLLHSTQYQWVEHA